MKLTSKLLFVLIIVAFGCQPKGKDGKYRLELIEENPYVLNINNFHWQKQSGSNMPVGEFEALNKEIALLLKGKTGICEIYFNPRSSEINNDDYIGFLMLSKDKDWETFFNRGGVRAMLEQKLSYKAATEASVDSAVIVTDTTKVVDSATVVNP